MTRAYLKVQIETGNAAFDDNEHYEIGRILIQLGRKMQREEFDEHCKLRMGWPAHPNGEMFKARITTKSFHYRHKCTNVQ